MARAERERVVECVFKKWNRPGPTRPGPTRPVISATRVRALKMADLGPPVFASFALFLVRPRLCKLRSLIVSLNCSS